MKFFHSIRWRLQLWNTLLLTLVLIGFGFTAWQLQRATLFQRVDQELEQRISVVAEAMRRGQEPAEGLPPPRRPLDRMPPRDRPPSPDQPEFRPPPPEERRPPRDLYFGDGPPGRSFYYVVWHPGEILGDHSLNAPADVPRPQRQPRSNRARSRGTLREYAHFTPPGDCILVGRDISEELARERHFAWVLGGSGAVVLLLGLAGGWWVSTRALRPIAAISATAAKISAGDLTQRILIADTSSELGVLAGVLNDTFARLQASFVRQAQFTADASHELRTPVSVVLTQTQTALNRERPANEYRESLAACQRAAQRMRRLTESLLTLARLDSGEIAGSREPCDLERVTREAMEPLRHLAAEQKVTLAIKSMPASCMGHPEQLAQIVTNLVANAIYYNRPGGTVDVNVSAHADAAVLTVSDTGQGIGAEDLPHIFERFYRADKARSSAAGRTGLGLAITKAIVEAHGGTIEVATALAQGSTFTVRLPHKAAPLA